MPIQRQHRRTGGRGKRGKLIVWSEVGLAVWHSGLVGPGQCQGQFELCSPGTIDDSFSVGDDQRRRSSSRRRRSSCGIVSRLQRPLHQCLFIYLPLAVNNLCKKLRPERQACGHLENNKHSTDSTRTLLASFSGARKSEIINVICQPHLLPLSLSPSLSLSVSLLPHLIDIN